MPNLLRRLHRQVIGCGSLSLATALVVLLFSTSSSAQSLKSLSLEALGAIEVTTANKQPETVWQTAAAIFVITQEDIRRSGATTLPDVLRLAPGVVVNQSDSNRWAVGVRGLADIFSKSVLVLIDGRSVYTPLVGGVHWAIQDVPLADVEQIEVIRGPGATIWGGNAVNGVINIITKRSADAQGVRGTAVAGSVEHARVWAEYGGRASENLTYRVYGKTVRRGAQYHADGADFDTWNTLQGGFRSDWTAGGRDTVTLSGDAYQTQTGERAEITLFAPPAVRPIDGTLDLSGGNVIVRWERRFSAESVSRLQAYFDRTTRDGFTFGETRNTFDVDFNMRHAPWKRNALAWGVNGRVSPSSVTQIIPSLNFVPNDKTSALASVFLQDTIALIPERLSLQAGTRVEHNDYTGVEWLPSARLLWTLGNRSLWTSVTRAVRTPSRFERDLDFQVLINPEVPIFAAIAGDSGFESESVLGTEVGYRQLILPTVYLDVAVYRNRYRGLASFAEPRIGPASAPVPHLRVTVPFTNGVDAVTRGFEVSPDWRPTTIWQLKGSYSFLDVTADNRLGITNPTQRDNYIGLSPRHQARVQSRLDLGTRFNVDQTYRYVSALTAARIPAYHTLDARFAWQISDRVQLSVVGQNLLQSHHAEFNAVPVEIRRGGYVQLLVGR
jgi:iron complex outermembrane recepter protein